jgi:hypothetical protein
MALLILSAAFGVYREPLLRRLSFWIAEALLDKWRNALRVYRLAILISR